MGLYPNTNSHVISCVDGDYAYEINDLWHGVTGPTFTEDTGDTVQTQPLLFPMQQRQAWKFTIGMYGTANTPIETDPLEIIPKQDDNDSLESSASAFSFRNWWRFRDSGTVPINSVEGVNDPNGIIFKWPVQSGLLTVLFHYDGRGCFYMEGKVIGRSRVSGAWDYCTQEMYAAWSHSSSILLPNRIVINHCPPRVDVQRERLL